MGELTMTAIVGGKTVTRTEKTPDAFDGAVLAWAEDAYAKAAGNDADGKPLPDLKGEDAIYAAMGGTMRGVMDNVKRHAVEGAKAQAEAAAKAQLAALEPIEK